MGCGGVRQRGVLHEESWLAMLTVRAARAGQDLHAWRSGARATTCGIRAADVTRTGHDWPPGLEVDGMVCPICMAAREPWSRRH
jgi:hypothetical protein